MVMVPLNHRVGWSVDDDEFLFRHRDWSYAKLSEHLDRSKESVRARLRFLLENRLSMADNVRDNEYMRRHWEMLSVRRGRSRGC